MEEEDLPSEDSGDEDYVPAGAASEVSSEQSEGEAEESGGEENEVKKLNGNKRSKSIPKKKSRKKIKLKTGEGDVQPEESPKENSVKVVNEEEQKKKADELWADFMKDCGPPVTNTEVQQSPSSENDGSKVTEEKENNSRVTAGPINPPSPEKVKVTEIFEFAGEKVQVEKEVKRESLPAIRGGNQGGKRGGGLSAVLGAIGKKSKLSTLEKSKLDWEKFKSQEGISEDIVTHNKGKNGYLEKQDFLERTDFRQFELEKQMRSSRRSNR